MTGPEGIVKPADFAEFFAAVSGHQPFAWQIRLVDTVLSDGRWPDRIVAPTGAGKSSVVDVHVFLNALYGAGTGPRVPRRLAVVVNRRALVDSHADRAEYLGKLLSETEDDSVLGAVRSALGSLRVVAHEGTPTAAEILPLTQLRGGLPTDRSWVDDPSACAVLCATPDMWGSSLLFRGYGSSRYARPRDAGMLAYDSVMVLDEAHLNRQLLVTARRIADLERDAPQRIGVPVLQVVETTATPGDPGSGVREVGVLAGDIAPGGDGSGEVLRRRLTTPKPIRYLPTTYPKTTGPYWDVLVEQVLAQHERFGTASGSGRSVACVVNTVKGAVEMSTRLKKRGLRVVTLVGRMRRYDVARLRDEHGGLFSLDGDSDVDVLVATQTVEVGVDADLASLVTELAPGAALAQRAGRVNRIGRSADTEVVVVSTHIDAMKDWHGPYRRDDLEAAKKWVDRLAATADGIAPWAVASDPPPPEAPRRTLYQRPELWDAWSWARTTEEGAARADLTLWLRDSLERDRSSSGIVVRSLPRDDGGALALLRAAPPVADEVFPCQRWEAEHRLAVVWDADKGYDDDLRRRAFVYRDGEVDVLDNDAAVEDGDIVILDDIHPVAYEGVAVDEPVAKAKDVYSECTGAEVIVWRGDEDPRKWDKDQRDLVDAAEADDPRDVLVLRVPEPRREEVRRTALVGPLAPDTVVVQALSWVVIPRGAAAIAADEEARQEWTASRAPVLLDDHNAAVADRGRALATVLGVAEDVAEALASAGLHHDAGKVDVRFQKLLGAKAEVLAKSERRTAQWLASGKGASGLPVGWRHEQLSVVLAAPAVGDSPLADLVLRLVGTSHGRGRSGFPHTAEELIGAGGLPAHAVELFDVGTWDRILDDTHRRWGVWGSAYLEALLRAADGQVSKEGR
ncbi:type I-U CRISPR-associated helicase/endonuclease Cas3 [Rhodococcus triatomae]|uniref:CRISPR-associated endonuclease/helicase Cas3 n=1 Tax=Rhodococcus triatomae TaxID=300028 RepID=A0A1G8IZE2_9NOCA|nr:type I-U CRISPR-associated helicase/endonuclease Cas3 [Rhodococcus triatomae]QNG19863.1 type I-U CRISPR-associated helicase/endonuclease Cas3 [Rhodococcus triatomae]QNG24221.1 type I-U CRISPR-associated helicase/endonuclease Cas3 [Rhodococcus triatomae]SDI24193.1 CRISPR-associated endonuclease/helicase Cas3 [Rhodococcus triatomae]